MQVLSKALEIWGLSCPSLDSPNMIAFNQNPTMAQAFMCNLRVLPPTVHMQCHMLMTPYCAYVRYMQIGEVHAVQLTHDMLCATFEEQNLLLSGAAWCPATSSHTKNATRVTTTLDLKSSAQEHWFTIRRIAGEFWDFNSLFPAPRPLTATYLETFLATLREQGYSIFVILGNLPAQGSPDQGSGNGAFYTPQQVFDCS